MAKEKRKRTVMDKGKKKLTTAGKGKENSYPVVQVLRERNNGVVIHNEQNIMRLRQVHSNGAYKDHMPLKGRLSLPTPSAKMPFATEYRRTGLLSVLVYKKAEQTKTATATPVDGPLPVGFVLTTRREQGEGKTLDLSKLRATLSLQLLKVFKSSSKPFPVEEGRQQRPRPGGAN
ncbi:hypothetical protein RHSIM_Rhsim04G0159700 [Rhododendron simsii]|uniref:Uncharacterized protein n=1 Tax=Rhododendron simsii TaxID=118357 RepID=A0A834H6P4_RHOSS|nr:hypothetical protein RHSIM_Rhsim04G0159700 [Rhododendron simsii]